MDPDNSQTLAGVSTPRRPLEVAEQRETAALCAQTGQVLMQHGAESALVESITRRLGVALGAENIQVAIMANAITVTLLCGGKSTTTVRRNEDRGINMQMVTEVQHAMLAVEEGRLDRRGYRDRIEALKPLRYPRWLLVILIGLSCACFAGLAGADFQGAAVAFVASAAAMAVRLSFAHFHFSPLIGFFGAAFVATSISLQAVVHQLGKTPKIAMAASVLLLVPGFPLINGVSDMVKGYINTGISRLVFAILLAGSTSAGILLAMRIWNVWGWL